MPDDASPPDDKRSDLASPAVVDAGRLERDPLKKDFRNFAYKCWMTWFNNPPTPNMYDVAYWFQHASPKALLMGYRGLAKSFITVSGAVWTLHCDPTEQVLTLSGDTKGAAGNASLAWSMVNGFDWLAHMKPRGMLRQSAQAFDVMGSKMEKSESFAALSLFASAKTGRRCTLAMPDDIETPGTSSTENDRALLRKHWQEVPGAILKPGGRVRGLGTAQTEETIYLEWARDKGYSLTIIPILYPRTTKQGEEKLAQIERYGGWLLPRIRKAVEENPYLAGTSTEPSRFDEADIDGRRLEYGTLEFERQFMLFLDAAAGKGQPLKLRDIPIVEMQLPPLDGSRPLKVPVDMTWSPDPDRQYKDIRVDALSGDLAYAPIIPSDIDWQVPDGIIMQVDPSGGGSDETAWGVLCQHLGRVGLVHQDARLEGFAEETLIAIAKDARRFRVQKIRIEKNYGGGMFGALLRPYIQAEVMAAMGTGWTGCQIEEENAGQQMKEGRIIDVLQPVITGHRLWIAAGVLRDDIDAGESYTDIELDKRRYYRLTYQITRMVKKRQALVHDDRVDMLAAGVGAFMGVLQQQLKEALKQNREALLMLEVEKLIETRRKQGLPLFGAETHSGTRMGGLLGDGGLNSSPLFRGRKP